MYKYQWRTECKTPAEHRLTRNISTHHLNATNLDDLPVNSVFERKVFDEYGTL